MKNVVTDRGEDSPVWWADCACLCLKATVMADADWGLLLTTGGLTAQEGIQGGRCEMTGRFEMTKRRHGGGGGVSCWR